MEQKCRALAKEKDLKVRKTKDHISITYTVTIRRYSQWFNTWEQALEFVKKYNK